MLALTSNVAYRILEYPEINKLRNIEMGGFPAFSLPSSTGSELTWEGFCQFHTQGSTHSPFDLSVDVGPNESLNVKST